MINPIRRRTSSLKGLILVSLFSVFFSATYCVAARESAESIFTPLFRFDPKKRGSSSGNGSDLIQTAVIREEIPKMIEQLKIKTMVDAPCGDFFWMKTVNLEVKKYTGVDVIRELIQKNQSDYGNGFRQFIHLDLTQDPVPKADLILCRDCLVHYSLRDIASILYQFKKSDSKYLLTTSFPEQSQNRSIFTGEWFPINLTNPPFNFPKPLITINENCTEEGGVYKDKSLCLWKLDDISLLNLQCIFDEPITVLSQPIIAESSDTWVHPAVLRSLKRGLKLLCVDFNFNPKNIEDLHENVLVLNNFDALKEAIRLKQQGKIKRLLVGPNLTFYAHEIQMSPEIDLCIAPSEWFRDMQVSQLPELKDRFALWFSGVNITFWDPKDPAKNVGDVLVYQKNGSNALCTAVEDQLSRRGWNPIRLTYGTYKLPEYKKLLNQCQFAVFLSESEMQGIALAEAWAMDVPTLVWDPKQCIYLGISFTGSSAPYLTQALGDSWRTVEELERLLDELPEKLKFYSPRAWTQKNMSDEASAYQLLKIFESVDSYSLCAHLGL